MNSTRKQQVERDAATIEKTMKNYSGAGAAHFGFIAFASGERQFLAGGNSQILGVSLAEGIADLIRKTPGLPAEFIDVIAEVAHKMLEEEPPQ